MICEEINSKLLREHIKNKLSNVNNFIKEEKFFYNCENFTNTRTIVYNNSNVYLCETCGSKLSAMEIECHNCGCTISWLG